jgi:hypothetical protein
MGPPRNKDKYAYRYKDLHIQPKRYKSRAGPAFIAIFSPEYLEQEVRVPGRYVGRASYGYYQPDMLYRGTDNKIHRFPRRE